ncbi:MAG: primosomal protein [Pseudomonadota bacterium]|jgi:primosomal protein N' (replication factor Y) (superfamily II helicase)
MDPVDTLLFVLVATPAHSGLGMALPYRAPRGTGTAAPPLSSGTLIRVPLGKRETLGVVVPRPEHVELPATDRIRTASAVLEGLAPLSAHWLALVQFAAGYYQRAAGEIALAALPPPLRELDGIQLDRRLKKFIKIKEFPDNPSQYSAIHKVAKPLHTAEQQAVLAQITAQTGPFLLFGATGSGKTEVYLQTVQDLLTADPRAQALVMVPEINLTPQLEARFRARFEPILGAQAVVAMHSAMTPPQRLQSWLAAHQGSARIVLGTRLAVFASMPHLRLIIVDEEHDPSYKQTEGARYSARDLAVWRGRNESARVILGSATPSLESWQHALTGRYTRLEMTHRPGTELIGVRPQLLPLVRTVDMTRQPARTIIAPPLLAAIRERAERSEQSLLLLNRRGYAPVLACGACEWKSECPHCSAYRVFHKIDRSLRCHHCGHTEPVPRACPGCGNVDLQTVGRGTEWLEEHLTELLGGLRIARMDADSTRRQGELERGLAQVHAGEVDVLVGTQMIAKGHDFRHVTLVAAINPDGGLFSSDFRAPERLFSLLLQAAGRAGRSADHVAQAEVWIQTQHPQHPLFAALKKHDFPGFAALQLTDRQQAGLPPFSFQALLRADARTQEAAQQFLQAAAQAGSALAESERVSLYPAVPLGVQRVANIERAQMLIESASRPALQRFMAAWQPDLLHLRQSAEHKAVVRWLLDVDPLLI